MNVCVISKWDCSGGAPRATYRLFCALRKCTRVDYLVHKKTVVDPDIHVVSLFERQKKSYYERLVQKSYVDNNRTPVSNTYFTITYNGADLRSNKYVHEADVINLHWVEKFLSLESINYLVSLGKPIVWTLHDERPFTGGCHYTAGCDGFANNNCLLCCQLVVDECGLPNAILECKKNILNNANLTIVSPSNWLAGEAMRSSVFSGKKVVVIPNSVEIDVYYPRSRQEVRKRHGIPQESFVILAGSIDNNEVRKGYNYYIKALTYCLKNDSFRKKSQNNQIVIVTFGGKSDSVIHDNIRHIDMGYVSDDNLMAEIYSASDIYVITTLEDNLPNTVLESMACGTSIVGFDTGGMPDMVSNDVNGILVSTRDYRALSESILLMVKQPETLKNYSVNAVKTIRSGYTMDLQSEKYMELFSSLKKKSLDYSLVDEASIYVCAIQQADKLNFFYKVTVWVKWILRRFNIYKRCNE